MPNVMTTMDFKMELVKQSKQFVERRKARIAPMSVSEMFNIPPPPRLFRQVAATLPLLPNGFYVELLRERIKRAQRRKECIYKNVIQRNHAKLNQCAVEYNLNHLLGI